MPLIDINGVVVDSPSWTRQQMTPEGGVLKIEITRADDEELLATIKLPLRVLS